MFEAEVRDSMLTLRLSSDPRANRQPAAFWVGWLLSLLAFLAVQGCCPCDRGFVLRGDWSLTMDRLGGDCPHCTAGCASGPDAAGIAHAPPSAAPIATPQFHPVPTAPVRNVRKTEPVSTTLVHPAVPPAYSSAPPPDSARDENPPELKSVLKDNVSQQPASSWAFVRPPQQESPAAAAPRKLTAEGWSGVRRR